MDPFPLLTTLRKSHYAQYSSRYIQSLSLRTPTPRRVIGLSWTEKLARDWSLDNQSASLHAEKINLPSHTNRQKHWTNFADVIRFLWASKAMNSSLHLLALQEEICSNKFVRGCCVYSSLCLCVNTHLWSSPWMLKLTYKCSLLSLTVSIFSSH